MFRLPTPKDRTVILGATGSGKSVFGLWLLSLANWDRMPWVIIDYKGDDLIEGIVSENRRQIKDIEPTSDVPKKPGLYYMRPDAKLDDTAVRDFLLRVYKRGKCGLFIDEGFAIPNDDELDMIFTQGRSKKIPVIVLYQRPVYMSRFAIAQASFFAHFDENDERDLKTVEQFIKPAKAPDGTLITPRTELPDYWCLWFDVSKRKTIVLKPSPSPAVVLDIFSNRLNPRKESKSECSAVTLC